MNGGYIYIVIGIMFTNVHITGGAPPCIKKPSLEAQPSKAGLRLTAEVQNAKPTFGDGSGPFQE